MKEKRVLFAIVFGVFLAVLIIVLALTQGQQARTATDDKETAQKENVDLRELVADGKVLATVIDETCEKGGKRLVSLKQALGRDICKRAEEVKEAKPAVGPAGRGIVSTDIINGRLFIAYTDGRVEDKGVVVGQNGIPGKTGKTGRTGRTGDEGDPGADGRGVTSSQMTAEGDLVLSYTDGTSENVGRVVGQQGPAGRGISSMAQNADNHLIVTYTDGSTQDIGPLPRGPQGERGATGPTWNSYTVQHENGVTETCTRDPDSPSDSPHFTCTDDAPPPQEPTPTTQGNRLIPGGR